MPLHLRLLIPALGLALGFAFGFIRPIGLACGVLFIAALLFGEGRLPHILWWGLSFTGCIALAAHLLPGFNPLPLWPERPLSADAPPYALRLSWDKLLVGLTLLAWWLARPHSGKALPQRVWLVALATLLVVPTLTLGIGLAGWQPKWPDQLWLWLLVNFGVAVLTEELLFRAWLQPALVSRLGAWPGVLLTAALFGALHLPFSPLFAVVATVAGLGYGLAFHYSGRLSVAVALHGTVNVLHLLLLSYPLKLA